MIFVSAGHHQEKKGACCEDFCEHDEAKIWASFLDHYLGDNSLMVPSGTLKHKVNFINKYASANDIAVEIHFNAAVDSDGNNVGKGSETLYYPGSVKGKELAKQVQSVLASIFQPDRGAKEGWYRMNPSFGADYFLQRTLCAALILEPDFIHRKEVIQSHRDAACKKLAEALNALDG